MHRVGFDLWSLDTVKEGVLRAPLMDKAMGGRWYPRPRGRAPHDDNDRPKEWNYKLGQWQQAA